MKKTHLGVNCHPYKYAWFVYCRIDLVEEDEYGKWDMTEEPKEATCKHCLKSYDKATKDMNDASV